MQRSIEELREGFFGESLKAKSEVGNKKVTLKTVLVRKEPLDILYLQKLFRKIQ